MTKQISEKELDDEQDRLRNLLSSSSHIPDSYSKRKENKFLGSMQYTLSSMFDIDINTVTENENLKHELSGEAVKVTAYINNIKFEYLVPQLTACKFEFSMLGGMGDLPYKINDDIVDTVDEIVSCIIGEYRTLTGFKYPTSVDSCKVSNEDLTEYTHYGFINEYNIFVKIDCNTED